MRAADNSDQDGDRALAAALARLAPSLTLRARRAEDAQFLLECTIACSPLQGTLPAPMIAAQAALQRSAHDAAHPDASHAIILRAATAIGHARIAWSAHGTHLIDLAILPAHQRRGAGGSVLAAWLALADASGRVATLDVQADNPARLLYARLGFTADAGDPWAAFVTMRRDPR